MKEVVIVAAKRSATGNFLGALASTSAPQIAKTVIQDVIADIDANSIDDVILGQVLQAGCGQNPARQAAIAAGIPQKTPAITLNKLCGSGMQSILYAYNAILLGDAEMVIAGGMENMSMVGHYLPGSRNGVKLGNWNLEDLMLKDGLTCALSDSIHMGITAENLAEKYGISKQDQDHFAVASQQKASAADQAGKFKGEITPIEIPQRKGEPKIFDKDEFIKHDASIESMQKLRPAFKKEGTVTAANASGINDGAAVVLLMSRDKADELGLKPLVKVIGFGTAGVDPTIMGIGPVDATKNCLNKIKWNINDIDLIESNEAFAAQSIAVNKELGWDTSKVNVNGGAIALGHPIGASGARIVTTLIHEMIRSDKKRGLATMCIGGGQGIASAFELA